MSRASAATAVRRVPADTARTSGFASSRRHESWKRTMNPSSALAAALLGLCLGCAGAEQEVVERYLAASQRGDTDIVASVSMVVFSDAVESWNVLEIDPGRHERFRLSELRQTVASIEQERDHQFKAFGEFRQENYDALRRIGERLHEDPDYRFPGQLGELQSAWELLRLERRHVLERLHDAEAAFEHEIRQVRKSLERETNPESLTGEIQTKSARVRVTTPDGDKRFRMSLSRYELKNQFDALVPARWVITAVSLEE